MKTPFQHWWESNDWTHHNMPLLTHEDIAFLTEQIQDKQCDKWIPYLESHLERHHTYYYQAPVGKALQRLIHDIDISTIIIHPFLFEAMDYDEKIWWIKNNPNPRYIWGLSWEHVIALFDASEIHEGLTLYIPTFNMELRDVSYKLKTIATEEPEVVEQWQLGEVDCLDELFVKVVNAYSALPKDKDFYVEYALLAFQYRHRDRVSYWEILPVLTEKDPNTLFEDLVGSFFKSVNDQETPSGMLARLRHTANGFARLSVIHDDTAPPEETPLHLF